MEADAFGIGDQITGFQGRSRTGHRAECHKIRIEVLVHVKASKCWDSFACTWIFHPKP